MEVIRQKCANCSRTAQPSNLLAGLCPVCLLNRADSFNKQFILSKLNTFDECYECHGELHGGAYLHWDVVADCFALLCMPCGEKAIQTDGQYRNTEFAYQMKAQ